MAPLVLEGDTLGKKHQYYNKLVRETANTDPLPELSQDDDIQNLLSVDIASKNRNVDYILKVLKSEDQLYVSKAIKRSTWLITDPQYAHIINPEHLYTELHPQMTSKAFSKLMLNIRLHLKDEKRVEAFYNYIKENNTKSAFKWLQHCSVPFIEIEVATHNADIPDYLVLRLFEKSFSIFEVYVKHWDWIVSECELLIRKHADKFLDVLEGKKDKFYFDFSAKGTAALMEKCPQRILDKFELYGKKLDIATFAKCLKKTENVRDFLLKHANNEKFKWLYSYDKIQHFIREMPKENRFDFVKKFFIDKENFTSGENFKGDNMALNDCAMSCRAACYNPQSTNTYQWYKFAPFDMAFTDLKKLIRAESVPDQRNLMLQVLLSCAGRNKQHIYSVLHYYYEKHINEPFKFKIQFVNSFVSKVDTHMLDDRTWNMLNQLFHSMEVFIESENNVQTCIKAIIVRNVVKKQPVPDIIKNKFVFDTLKTSQTKLKTQDEKDAVFEYLCNFITAKTNPLNLTIESEFNEAVNFCENLLNLIKDWGKDLKDHPFALDRIRTLIKVKKEKGWSRDLSTLYNTKKSWRRAMFDESIDILPTEKVCLNALKHDPGLLSRNKEQVLALSCNDSVSLKYLLSKMRIYWPNTFAEDFKINNLIRLNQHGGHKALIIGLCALLPQKDIIDLLTKYAPSETKIDWNEADQLELSLRKQIAKNIYKARPLAPVKEVLLYAKGDYLQYVVPSLNSILSQMSPNKSRLCVPMLLDAPVSLQKFGVRCAFHKLTPEELKPMFSELWNSTKNSSIRTVLFTHTYDLLCKEKNASHIKDTWDLLSMFIDKLTSDENKVLYKKLGDVGVPDSIKPQFYMKSYAFLSSLPAKCNCESILNNMQSLAHDFMESLDDDFVVNVMLKKFNELFIKERYIYTNTSVIATFILASKDEEIQMRRYEISFGALLEKYLPLWENVHEDQFLVKNHLKDILERLADSLSYTFEKKMQIPLKVFEAILIKLENALSYQKDYVTLTLWKLMVAFVKILDESQLVTVYYKIEAENKSMTNEEKDKMYTDTHKQMAPVFAKICVQYLKEDLKRFGSSIYPLFSQALTKFFHSYLSRSMCKLEDQTEYAISMLQYKDEKEVWLMMRDFLETDLYNIYSDSEKKKYQEIREIVFSHPSDEIKMHYYDLFADLVPFTASALPDKE